MSRWKLGEADIERLLASGHLQQVTGAQANGTEFIDQARKTLATATAIALADPENAYVLAYKAARHACDGLLAQQGLRATSAGGHYALQQAVVAQFGKPFESFGLLRRRRNDLDYPDIPGERVEQSEISAALVTAEALVDSAAQILPLLGIFS